jgi:hypothetical protein
MKNLRYALVAFTVLFIATAAHAQTSRVAASIPFNFVVGDHDYPAGDYLFANNGVVLQITNTQNAAPKTMILSQPCEKLTAPTQTKVVFERMGGSYFLQQIWVAGESRGRELPKSKSELRLAQNHEKSDTVIVAANIVK